MTSYIDKKYRLKITYDNQLLKYHSQEFPYRSIACTILINQYHIVIMYIVNDM